MTDHDTVATAATKASPLVAYFTAKLAAIDLPVMIQWVTLGYGLLMMANQCILLVKNLRTK
jgi:hypothetical protein